MKCVPAAWVGMICGWPSAQAVAIPCEEPTNLAAVINSSADEEAPFVSHDGLTLIFSSERAGTWGFDDLWMCTRPATQDPWSQPVNMELVLSSNFYELYGQLSPDGLVLFINPFSYGDILGAGLFACKGHIVSGSF